MSQPTNYTPTTDFSQQEAMNASGRSTVNTSALDAEFANIETTIDQTLSNLTLLQRDDGRLKDVIVDIYTLAPDVLNLMGGFNLRGLWAALIDYAKNDVCSNGAYTYVCRTAHTSGGAFDAINWIQFGFTSGADAAQAAAAAQVSADSASSSAILASTGAATATTKASQATASATSASVSSSSASTSASAANASATNAANSAAAAAVSVGSINFSLTSASTFSNKTLDGSNTISEAKGHLSGFRNILINGDMRINQRGVTIAAASIGAYGPDRWKKVDASNMTQIVEAGNFVPSATYTLSGTGLTTGQIVSPASSNWTLPNIPIAATNIQLELGAVATPLEIRPYGLELSLCQRYLPAYSGSGVIGSAYSGGATSAAGLVAFPVTARVKPTGITVLSAAHYQYGNASGNYVASVITFNSASDTNAVVIMTTTGIAAANLPGTIASNNASAILLFNGCEL